MKRHARERDADGGQEQSEPSELDFFVRFRLAALGHVIHADRYSSGCARAD